MGFLSVGEFDAAAKRYERFWSREDTMSDNTVACLTLDGRSFRRRTLVNLLRKGSGPWNKWLGSLPAFKWRRSTKSLSGGSLPGYAIDLRGADLRRLDLSGCYFGGVNFSYSRLTRANLSHVSFDRWPGATFVHQAKFAHCDFRSANLTLANMGHCDFSFSNMSRADLNTCRGHSANFEGVDFSKTLFVATFEDSNFVSANFDGASLFASKFIDIDLSKAKNLDRCNFAGPCVLDHRTLFKSGQLPEKFYRGCGLPDLLIEYLPSLLNQPIQLYSCFISYSSKDEEFVKRLYSDLQANGVRCWFAPENLRIGTRMRGGIDEAVRIYDRLVLVVSEHSINSDWVEQEVEAALEKERETGREVIVPIRIDDHIFESSHRWAPHIRRTRHLGDFSKWKTHDSYNAVFNRLLSDLKRHEQQVTEKAN